MAARQGRDLRLLRCEARFRCISPSRYCTCNNHSTRSFTDGSLCLLSLSLIGAKWRLFLGDSSFSLSRRSKHVKSPFSGASRTRTKISTNDRKTDGVGSMSILSSLVATSRVSSSIAEIIASQNDEFDADVDRKKENSHRTTIRMLRTLIIKRRHGPLEYVANAPY